MQAERRTALKTWEQVCGSKEPVGIKASGNSVIYWVLSDSMPTIDPNEGFLLQGDQIFFDECNSNLWVAAQISNQNYTVNSVYPVSSGSVNDGTDNTDSSTGEVTGPTLANAQEFQVFYYKDVGEFILSSQQDTPNANRWEVFISNVSFSEITDLVVRNNSNVQYQDDVEYHIEDNNDGTFNHRITSNIPVNSYESIIIEGGLVGSGSIADLASKPDFVSWYTG